MWLVGLVFCLLYNWIVQCSASVPVWTSTNELNTNGRTRMKSYASTSARTKDECALLLRRIRFDQQLPGSMPPSFKALIESLRGNSV